MQRHTFARDRNPEDVSITELEFNEALRLQRPILLFIMGDEHLLREVDVEPDSAKKEKLKAFRERAKQMKPGSTVHRVYATFDSLEDFTSKAIQAVAGLRRHIDELDKTDPPAEATPAPIINLPQRKTLFIGREPEIESLRQQLQEPGSLAYISGVAGRGKTSLALEYAHRHKGEFESVHWLTCQQRSLVQIAGELAFQLGLKLDGDIDNIVHELNGHCAQKRCLLVLDNVDDETSAPLFAGGRTSVLITTRFTNLRFLRHYQPVNLPLFTEEQCFELFRKEISKEEVDRHEADARLLFQRLGCLPIGVAIAASLIREDVRYTIEEMARNLPADTYELLRDAVAALSTPAQTLLAAMAVCAPEGFRLSLAAEIAELDEEASLNALQEIHSRSLAEELDRSTRRYRLHALVREAVGATDDRHRKHAEAIRTEFENWETDWRKCETDMADCRAAVAWLLSQSDDTAWWMANNLAYQGYLLTYRLGRLPEAYEICEQMAREADKRKDLGWLQGWYSNQALIQHGWGRLKEAMELHEKAEGICLELGDKDGLQIGYGNQAVILTNWGRREEAMALLKKQEAICLEVGNRRSLAASYGNQALILKGRRGRLDEAMALHKKEEAIYLELGDQNSLHASYNHQGLILQRQGRLEEAMALHKKQEEICLELGNRNSLSASYGNQALILTAWGRLEEAVALHEKAEAIGLELRLPISLAYCYWQWGLTARKLGDGKTEREKLGQSLALFTELKMPRQVIEVQVELFKTRLRSLFGSLWKRLARIPPKSKKPSEPMQLPQSKRDNDS